MGAAAFIAGGAARAQSRVEAWPKGRPLAPVLAFDLNGTPQALPRSASGQPRAQLINLWATWCEPCVRELPGLQAFAARHADRLEVIALHHSSPRQPVSHRSVQAFVERNRLQLPVLIDPEGLASKQWGLNALPGSLLIDAQGRPRLRVLGEVDWSNEDAQRLLLAALR